MNPTQNIQNNMTEQDNFEEVIIQTEVIDDSEITEEMLCNTAY